MAELAGTVRQEKNATNRDASQYAIWDADDGVLPHIYSHMYVCVKKVIKEGRSMRPRREGHARVSGQHRQACVNT